MADGSVKIKIDGDASGYKAALNDVTKTTTTEVNNVANVTQSVFSGIMKAQILTKGITLAVNGLRTIASTAIDVGRSIVSNYANYEQLVGGVDTLFKGASKTVQTNAEQAFKTVGLSANAYMETVTGFSASMIQSLDGDTAKAAELSDQAIRDMSDNANKMGTDMVSIQNAYQGFAKQNYTMLDNLKLGYGGTKTEMQRLLADAEKLTGKKYDISSFADITEAIHAIQTEMDITGTTAKEAEGTISGSISMLKASVEDLLTGFGNPAADIDALFNNVFNSLKTVMGNITPVIGTIISKIPDAFAMIGDVIAENIDTIINTGVNLLSNLGTVLAKAMPKLAPAVMGGVKKLMDLVGKQLPDLIRGAMNRLPDLISGLGEAIPQIVDFASQIVAQFAESLVAALPEIVPALLKALPGILVSLAEGVLNIIHGIFSGWEDILKDAGLMDKTLGDVLNDQLGNVDANNVAKISSSIEAHIDQPDTEAYAAELKTAIDTLKQVVQSIPGLTDDEKAAIEKAVLEGSGHDVLVKTLEGMGVDPSVAEASVATIEESMDKINTIVANLGLDPETEQGLQDLIANDATAEDIETYLKNCGIDADTAKAAAESITTESDKINEAVKTCGLDENEVWRAGLRGELQKELLVESLKKLGLSDEDIASIVGSYDTLSGSISGSMQSIFDDVVTAFTNGEYSDDSEAARTAKEKINTLFDTAKAKVEEWRDAKIKELQDSGLTGDALTAAVDEVNKQADGMIDKLDASKEAANSWVDENAGAATEVVQGHLTQLEDIMTEVGLLDAQIAELTGELTPAGINNMKAVKTGKIADQELQGQALATAKDLYDTSLAEATDKRSQAISEAAEKYGDDVDAYAAAIAAADDQYAKDVQAAEDQYSTNMNELMAGILMANNPEGTDLIQGWLDNMNVSDAAQTVRDKLAEIFSPEYAGNFDYTTFLGEDGQLDAAALLDSLGISSIDQASLEAAFASQGLNLSDVLLNAFTTGGNLSPFTTLASTFATDFESSLATAMSEGTVDLTGFAEVWTAALDTGLLTTANGIDYTSFESSVMAAMTSSGTSAGSAYSTAVASGVEDGVTTVTNASSDVEDGMNITDGAKKQGENAGQGYVNGIGAKLSEAVRLARQKVKEILDEMAKTQDSHSPSKKTMALGMFAGEGYEIGITESLNHAMSSAKRIVGSLNLSPSMDFSGIRAALDGSMQTFAEAESGREVALYINGTKLATTTAPDNNTALNGFNRQIALGYGRG